MFTLVGYSESQDTAGALTPVAALADTHITRSGDDIIIPELNKIVLIKALGATISRARLVSPSLRRVANFEVSPVDIAAEPTSGEYAICDLRNTPIQLMTDEALNAEVVEGAVGAEQETVLVWLADGSPVPVAGEIFTVRATASQTLTAFAWTNGVLTFTEDLPVGNYQVVGMRAEAAGLIAARLNFVGGIWRPGCLGCDDASDIQDYMFRYGRFGVWGEFSHNRPPTVDFLSVSADTTETVWFDLIKTA